MPPAPAGKGVECWEGWGLREKGCNQPWAMSLIVSTAMVPLKSETTSFLGEVNDDLDDNLIQCLHFQVRKLKPTASSQAAQEPTYWQSWAQNVGFLSSQELTCL